MATNSTLFLCRRLHYIITIKSRIAKLPKRVILILQLLDAKNKPQENQDNDFSTRHKKGDYVFHIGSEIIDIVQNYTYLGTRSSSSGNFTLSLEHLRQKALHAFFGLRRHTDFNKLNPSLACKIFDSMISPILTYLTQVLGAFAKSDFKSWDSSAIKKLIYNSVNVS